MALFKNIERYNFYKAENKLKEGEDNFFKYLDEILESGEIEDALTILKTSGLSVSIFNNKRQKKFFSEAIEYIKSRCDNQYLSKIEDLSIEASHFENIFNEFDKLRTSFFEQYEAIDDKYKVVSYIISLELYLRNIINEPSENIKTELIDIPKSSEHNMKAALFDSAIESTGMILSYFKYKEYDFKGNKRNISPKILNTSLTHIVFSEIWNELNDILEYWKYSNVHVSKKGNGKISFEITDKEFELNNLISNDRFNNLRQGWQTSVIRDLQIESDNTDKSIDDITSKSKSKINYLFATLYFGSPLLEESVNGVQLKEWLRAYELLITLSQDFLLKNKRVKAYNLDKVCLSKSFQGWSKIFQRNGFSKEDSKKIIEVFTFDNRSQDLVDCPFIDVDNQLIILPSLTSQSDAPRALASNFLNRHLNLDFKGPGFEDRTKAGLKLNNLNCKRLYKKTKETEFECDIAFVLDDELFFVECKAHVQPFTTRQHANHLSKLYKETYQLNRIAEYYKNNLQDVIEQLNLTEGFVPKETHNILLTTSMIGSPIFVNGVHIIDESSFTKFVDREPPSLKYFEKGNYFEKPSTKFDIYKGRITAKKMLEFLSYPPQIKITGDLYTRRNVSLKLFDLKRHFKSNHTMHIGANPSESEQSLIDKYY